MNKKILVPILIVILIVASSLFLFSEREAKRESFKVIGIGSFSQAIDYGPLYVAKHFSWFEKALQGKGNYKINYYQLGGFVEINTALAEDELHMFFSAEAPVIKLVSDGNKIKIAGISCTLQQDILVTKDSGIQSVEQLKGKDVAVAEGTSSHFGLLKILSSKNIDKEEIVIRPGFPGEIIPLFESGEVDAWAVWPPFVEQQIVNGNGFSLAGGNAKIQSVASIKESILVNEPEVAELLVESVEKAKSWMRNNPEEAMSIVAQALGLELEVVRLSWSKHNWGAKLEGQVLEDIQEKSIFLKEVGTLSRDAKAPTIDELLFRIKK